jgi:hypothetical protein
MDMSSPRCAARWSSSALGTKRTNAMAPVMSAKCQEPSFSQRWGRYHLA